ncbi:prolyl oligopeptidase family serine peptidase [uncultured Psychroserpens sp.]|uniref:prolyl oligopeptidase family serine peptidase n=1 Tax=uncultured Psychroserpens sp. TaxID=255436 RepID=UPI0026183565|nr:prolyl oligopeptidase family serine peptidase [uncultured Psychroserpens sp.]
MLVHKLKFSIFVSSLMILASCKKSLPSPQYPESNKTPITDTLFDQVITDNYRWLEHLNAQDTKTWIDEQEAYYNKQFLKHKEHVDTIFKSMNAYQNFTWHEPVFQKADYFFYRRKDPHRKSEIIIRKKDLNDEGDIIFDPEQELKDNESFLGFHDVSNNGKYLAILPNNGSSSWHTIRIKNIETNTYLTEEIDGIQTIGPSGNVLWNADSSGFFYLRFDAPDVENELSSTLSNARIMFHKLHTSSQEDILVFNQPEKPDNYFIPYLSNDQQYIIIKVVNSDSPGNDIYYKKVTHLKSTPTKLLGDTMARFTFEASEGVNWYFSTNLHAPNKKIIKINIENPSPKQWKTIVNEGIHPINTVNRVGSRFVIKYIIDAHQELHVFDFDGNFKNQINLPKLGYIVFYPDHTESPETFIGIFGPFFPAEIYKINSETYTSELIYQGFKENLNETYELKQVFYKSKDGTTVPMYLTHKKGIKLNSKNKVLLFGYGAYGSIGFPGYSPQILQWLDMGGIYAYANIRGGGEYGESWHQGGIKQHKQNAFDDFNSAAEWLIDNNYTSRKMIAANGISASGSTAITSVMQRPDLYGAALISVPTLDLTRFHLFTGGKTKMNEFGNPNVEEDLVSILKYSPYHNLNPIECLPPTIVQVGENDQTAVPSHGYKFVAAAQQNQNCNNPILLKVSRQSGHGKGNTIEERNFTEAQELAFIFKYLSNHD